jgi:hypothetical protein
MGEPRMGGEPACAGGHRLMLATRTKDQNYSFFLLGVGRSVLASLPSLGPNAPTACMLRAQKTD